MSHVHPLRFEALEARELLSRAHLPAHPAAHVATTLLAINGTLSVDDRARQTTLNGDGSTINAVPVAGQLGVLGTVHGVWNESADAYGESAGPDSIRLRNAHGAFFIVFNNQNNGRGHPLGHGAVFYQHTQQVHGGTGAYSHAVEHGTIQIITNNARTKVVSLVLASN